MKYHFIFLLIFLSACANDKSAGDNYSWLEGSWESQDGKASESWSKISEQSFNGIGYSHYGDTTRISEYLRLYVSDNKWTLEAKVIGQNNGKEISFKESKKSSSNILKVENLQHDFPKSISYNFITEDSIKVSLNEGLKNKVEYKLYKVEEIKNLSFIE